MSEHYNILFHGADLELEVTARVNTRWGYSPDELRERDLGRHYQVLAAERALLNLTENEALLLCDVLNGTIMEPFIPGMLWVEVHDAIELDGADQNWGVNGAVLLEKLRNLSPGGVMTILDAVERWWAHAGSDARQKLRDVELVQASRPGEYMCAPDAEDEEDE